jgi:hypothetical protein
MIWYNQNYKQTPPLSKKKTSLIYLQKKTSLFDNLNINNLNLADVLCQYHQKKMM